MTQPPNNLTATDIESVIRSLNRIIEWAKETGHRCGYFAALYRKVTIAVRDGIIDSQFEDGPRMERLDVIFANRYLDAFERYMHGEHITHAWEIAFHSAQQWHYIVLQHLMFGMNAHIGLDLGIAAAETQPSNLQSLRADFNKINDILSQLVNAVQDELSQIWPMLKILDRLAGRMDEHAADVIMKLTRNQAWSVAERLAQSPQDDWPGVIQELDQKIAATIGLIEPSGLLRVLLVLIRLTEMRSVQKIISILE